MESKICLPINMFCQVKDHNNKPLDLLCMYHECKKNRILCSKCAILDHQECFKHIVDISDVFKGNSLESTNTNAINDPKIKEAIKLLNKYNILDKKGKLIEIFEEKMNAEFEKVTAYFLEKVKETKEKMMAKAHQICFSEDMPLELFKSKLEELYNMDVFVSVLESLKNNQKTNETVSKELSEFLEDRYMREKQSLEIQKIAKTISNFTKNLLELEERPFNKFKTSLPFHIFDEFPIIMGDLVWDVNKKSTSIELSEDNSKASKKEVSVNYNTGVIGTLEFSSGIHKWEIEIHTGKSDKNWISFGVIEKSLLKDGAFENFPYSNCVALCANGTVNNMKLEGKMPGNGSYDDRTYACELDMEEGTFTISHEDKVVARQSYSLKGKIMVPCADLYFAGNYAIIRSTERSEKTKMHVKTPK